MGILENGVYRLKNTKSGTYLDASSKTPGKVQGFASRPESQNQQWIVETNGDAYTIKNLSNNQFLSVDGTKNGTNVRVSGTKTRWSILPSHSSIVILVDGSQASVDLDNGRVDNEAPVNVWELVTGSEHQRWIPEQVHGAYHPTG